MDIVVISFMSIGLLSRIISIVFIICLRSVIKSINKRWRNEHEDSFGNEVDENQQTLSLINPDSTSIVTFGIKSSKISHQRELSTEERPKISSLFQMKDSIQNSDSTGLNNMITSTNFPPALESKLKDKDMIPKCGSHGNILHDKSEQVKFK